MKLNIKAFAMTAALVWGFGLFALTWWVILFDGATGEATTIGLAYGFFDALVVGAVFAWLYIDWPCRESTGQRFCRSTSISSRPPSVCTPDRRYGIGKN